MLKKTLLSAGIITAGVFGLTAAANAEMQAFSVSGLATADAGYPLNVSVVFTPNTSGPLTVQIFNTSIMKSDAEGVFGVKFGINDGSSPIVSAPTMNQTTLVGQQWNATKKVGGGPPRYTYTMSSSSYMNPQLASPWLASVSTTGTYAINVDPTKIYDLVIGSPTNASGVTTAGGSVYERNPTLVTGATFTLDGITGLSTATKITDVVLQYGTVGLSTPLAPTAIPEPASLALLALGGVPLLLMRQRGRSPWSGIRLLMAHGNNAQRSASTGKGK